MRRVVVEPGARNTEIDDFAAGHADEFRLTSPAYPAWQLPELLQVLSDYG